MTKILYLFLISHSCNMFRLSHPPGFDNRNNTLCLLHFVHPFYVQEHKMVALAMFHISKVRYGTECQDFTLGLAESLPLKSTI
jgi:hypothetical protein